MRKVIFLIFTLSVSIFFSEKNKNKNNEIKIKLITSVHKDLPFKFETQKKSIVIKPGEVKTINYTVKNLSTGLQSSIDKKLILEFFKND